MKQVCDGVFIGDRNDAIYCLTRNTEVGHILTIENEPLGGGNDKKLVLKHVQCVDEPEADILSYLDDCVQFILNGLKESEVLVHCSAGVSRSATIIVAFMMQTQNIELNKAMDNLKSIYPIADPNPGFLYQLDLFEAMGRKVDMSSSLYKQFRLQMIAKDLEKTGCTQLPAEVLEKLTPDPKSSFAIIKQKSYRCRKCRCQLFNGSNCLQHVPGSGQKFLPWYSKSVVQRGNRKTTINSCTSYFIEPVEWMMPLLVGTIEGKLSCPKCSGRIGSFNWAGEQCSCGRWITPAFQLHKSRIDEK